MCAEDTIDTEQLRVRIEAYLEMLQVGTSSMHALKLTTKTKGGESMLKIHSKKMVVLGLFCTVLFFGFTMDTIGFCSGINEVETEKIAVNLVRDVQKGGYGIVRTDELKQWMDQKKEMLIVFTGPEAGFRKSHYPGAVQFELSIPELKEMSEKTKSAFIKLLGQDKNRALIFYCGFTKCTRSHNGAMWAIKLGYTNVYRCPGGIKGWIQAGFPVEKGE